MGIRKASAPAGLRHDVALAPLTTLELGGAATEFVAAYSDAEVGEALRWATGEHLPIVALGGGSNVVVADAGFPGLVVALAQRGILVEEAGDFVRIAAAAGENWDDLVARTVAEGWAGLECLSGIPGTVGATPVQNVGAYGQEVGETIVGVRVLDRTSLTQRDLTAAECSFGYRTSAFRRAPERFVVLAVTFALRGHGAARVAYAELAHTLAVRTAAPTLTDVRAAVLELRRGKAMVSDACDPDSRSVGSFFVNPVVTPETAAGIVGRAVTTGLVASSDDVPRFATRDSRVKIPAAWLVEHSGFVRGFRRGAVGISSRHALALVHHGGGSTADLIDLAREIRTAVVATFGVDLAVEPTFLGFPPGDPLAAT